MNWRVNIGEAVLANPITVASGTAGYGEELASYLDLARLGAIFTKGLSLAPRAGNPGNRIMETPSGVLNSIGLENVGLERFLTEKLPFLRAAGATVIPNVAGHSADENVELCRELSRAEGVAAVELNVSCPNVKEGGMAFGTNLPVFTDLLDRVRAATAGPLIVKLSPNVTDIAAFARRAEECGADALSAVNTFLGMKIDVDRRSPWFANRVAGLSGPAIRPLAVRAVYQVCAAVDIPVIGEGGIAALEDILEFLMAGAAAVSIGTMNMVEPGIALRLLDELADWCDAQRIDSLETIIGAVHREPTDGGCS